MAIHTPIFGPNLMNDIMIDLETLDTCETSVVTSIGAVAFDPYTKELGPTFYVELMDDLAIQQANGCTISADTVRWWMDQGAQAKQLFSYTPAPHIRRVKTLEALELFSQFVTDNGGNRAEIWGNGADFDNVILGNLYRAMKVPRPWSYSRNRCFRTVKSMGIGPTKYVRHGVHHNALDDAVTQAKHLQEIFACLRTR